MEVVTSQPIWTLPIDAWQVHCWSDGLRERSSAYSNAKICRELNAILEAYMAKDKKGHVVGNGAKNPQFTEFVNYTLDPDIQGDIDKQFPTQESVWTGLQTLLESGYKVSFSYDFPRSAVIVALTCRNEESTNNGKTLTSFAGDWYDALKVAQYKHFYALDEDWTNANSGQSRPVYG